MASLSLHVTQADGDGTAEIALDGELDLASVTVLRTALDEALASRARRVVIDAARLSYMDSSGISCLMSASEQARAVGARVVVRNAVGVVERVMSITGVDDQLLEQRS